MDCRRYIRKPPRKHSSRLNLSASDPLTVHDLPSGVLFKVFEQMHLFHLQRVREVSRRLGTLTDEYVYHLFKKELHHRVANAPSSCETATFQVINWACEIYEKSGFHATFCCGLLHLFRRNLIDPLCPKWSDVVQFLKGFYNAIDDQLGSSKPQKSRLLFAVTLLRMLKCFEPNTLTDSSSFPTQWHYMCEVQGAWLGIEKTDACTPSITRNYLLVFMSELLLHHIAQKTFKCIWECDANLHIFIGYNGIDERSCETMFKIFVEGSNEIVTLLRSIMNSPLSEFAVPEKWPTEQFLVQFDINSWEAVKCGCKQKQHFQFGPDSDDTDDSS